MTTSQNDTAGEASAQRDALERSERAATETEPANFRDEANAEKIVEIPPVGTGQKPIRGLDPK